MCEVNSGVVFYDERSSRPNLKLTGDQKKRQTAEKIIKEYKRNPQMKPLVISTLIYVFRLENQTESMPFVVIM